MSVNLEYYRAFYYAATLGSLGKAADAMCLTPPTVTKTIQSLENQIGFQLFVRTSKGVRLTNPGEILFSRVKPALNIIFSGEQELNMIHSLEGGAVRIAASEAIISSFDILQTLQQFHANYPKVNLVIKHYASEAARDAIINGEIDFSIMSIRDDSEHSGFTAQLVFNSDNVPVISSKYEQIVSNEVSLRELNEIPLIFIGGRFSVRSHYEALYKKYGMEFNPSVEVPSLALQLKMVQLGMGYTFVPYTALKSYEGRDDIRLLLLKEEPVYKRRVYLLTHDEIPLSRAAQILIDMIMDSTDNMYISDNQTNQKTSF